jgi:hypothetical protein
MCWYPSPIYELGTRHPVVTTAILILVNVWLLAGCSNVATLRFFLDKLPLSVLFAGTATQIYNSMMYKQQKGE